MPVRPDECPARVAVDRPPSSGGRGPRQGRRRVTSLEIGSRIVSTIIELRSRSSAGIFAVPFRNRDAGRAVPLPDGAIVEMPTPDQRSEAPERIVEVFNIAQGGIPATIHHANLGLIVAHLPFDGIYLLPSGDVAAVYGAVSHAIN